MRKSQELGGGGVLALDYIRQNNTIRPTMKKKKYWEMSDKKRSSHEILWLDFFFCIILLL